MKTTIALLVALATLSACNGDPKTYEECLLKNAAVAQSDKGAGLIAIACTRKFPQKNPFDQFDQKPSGK